MKSLKKGNISPKLGNFDIENFEKIFKKCKYLTRFYFKNISPPYYGYTWNLFSHLIKLCRTDHDLIYEKLCANLKYIFHIDIIPKYLKSSVNQKILRKFESSIKCLSLPYLANQQDLNFILNLPKLERLNFEHHISYSITNIDRELLDKLTTLKTFKFCYHCVTDIPVINNSLIIYETLLKNNKNLEKLILKNELKFYGNTIFIENLYNLQKLNFFEGEFWFSENSENQYNKLYELSRSFRTLSYLILRIRFEYRYRSNNGEILNSILKFMSNLTNLTFLRLTIYTQPQTFYKEFTAEALKNSPKLIYLSIKSFNNLTIHNEFFVNISGYLPNLKYLKLEKVKLSSKILEEIRKMKNLKLLYLEFLTKKDYEDRLKIFKYLSQNTNIKSVALTYDRNIHVLNI